MLVGLHYKMGASWLKLAGHAVLQQCALGPLTRQGWICQGPAGAVAEQAGGSQGATPALHNTLVPSILAAKQGHAAEGLHACL